MPRRAEKINVSRFPDPNLRPGFIFESPWLTPYGCSASIQDGKTFAPERRMITQCYRNFIAIQGRGSPIEGSGGRNLKVVHTFKTIVSNYLIHLQIPGLVQDTDCQVHPELQQPL